MQRFGILLLAGLATVGFATSAGAAAINWEGTAIIRVADFPPGFVTGGGVATVTPSSGHVDSLRLAQSRGGVEGTFTRFVTDPETVSNQIFAVQFIAIAGQTGTLTPISGGLDPVQSGYNGRLPVGGLIKLCLLNSDCSVTADLELTQPDPTRPGGIRGVGIGGLLTIDILGGFANVSVQAKPWQIATATLIDQIELPTPSNQIVFIDKTLRGFAHGPSSASSSSAAIPTPSSLGGIIQLVAPNQVLTNLTTGTSDKIGGGQRFIIRFIPEPGLLLLLGSAVAGLALISRHRIR